jgi:hypothetical protein
MSAIEEVLGDFATTPIEPYIKELATSRQLPSFAVALCALRYPDSGPFLRAALERAANGALTDGEDERLFFRALFIVGGRRDPLGFEPLLRFLRRPHDEVEFLLDDAVTEHLARIAAGVFDGKAEALFEAIADLTLDEYVRDALLGAATFLAWDGPIERERMVSFLRRFDSERLAPDEDMAWYAWTTAVSLLGLRDMEPAVIAAWERGSVPGDTFDRKYFTDDLAQAEQAPDDIGRFKAASLGYIEDVLEALQWYADEDDESDVFDKDEWTDLPLKSELVVNPWRHVGRNDPCPCGSGKKAKRCCLAA